MSSPDRKRIIEGLLYFLQGNPLPWLLDPAHPTVRFRTLLDIFEYGRDHEVVAETEKNLQGDPVLKHALSSLEDALKEEPDGKEALPGASIERMLSPLSVLVRAPAPSRHPVTDKGVRTLSRFLKDNIGDDYRFKGGLTPLLFARALSILFESGWKEEPAYVRWINLSLGSRIKGGGWSCSEEREDTPCPLTTLAFLRALGEVPELRDHWEVERSIDFLLDTGPEGGKRPPAGT